LIDQVDVTDVANFNRIVQGLQHPAMLTENDSSIPVWPEKLQHVDVVKARFVLDFISPCQVQPADFLRLGRVLRMAGSTFLDSHDALAIQQWKALFQPALSDDPVARRKFQKPAPAFVVTMPMMQNKAVEAGDQLDLDVLFLGTGIPLIREFLRSLIHLGHLGLDAGEGRFEVTGVYNRQSDGSDTRIWRQYELADSLACSVQPLIWLLQDKRMTTDVTVKFMTPTRLMVDGKPLRRPKFENIFPFMLRRASSMLYAHCGVEVLDDPAYLFAQLCEVNVIEARLRWHDWRSLSRRQGLVIGGFMGEMVLQRQTIDEIYWVIAVASLFGIGKGATYGAGRFDVS